MHRDTEARSTWHMQAAQACAGAQAFRRRWRVSGKEPGVERVLVSGIPYILSKKKKKSMGIIMF